MPGNCFLKTCSFKSNVTPPKTNIHTKNDGLEDVYIPCKNMAIWGIYVTFRGCKDLPIEVHDVKPSKGGGSHRDPLGAKPTQPRLFMLIY